MFDGIYLLLGEDGAEVNKYGFPILQCIYGKFFWGVNNHAHVITGRNGFSVEWLYLLFHQTELFKEGYDEAMYKNSCRI